MKIYDNRATVTFSRIEPNKTVLYLGCVGMGKNAVIGGCDNIFGRLDKSLAIGLDINSDGVKELNDLGYHAKVQDLNYEYDLKRKFDYVVTEENIEHISNLRTYLEMAKKHLKKDGKLLVTTPNANCAEFFLQYLLWGRLRVNLFHTHLHSRETITYLLNSNGFEIEEYEVFQAVNSEATNLSGKMVKLFWRLLPNKFGRTIFIKAKVQNDN